MSPFLTRSLYLGYYLKDLEVARLRRFMNHVRTLRSVSLVSIYTDLIRSVYLYNVSLLDYFYFQFYDKTPQERSVWAGTGFMYEYQRMMNPPDVRVVLQDKIRFLNHFQSFVRRPYVSLGTLRTDPFKASNLLENPSGRVVVKDAKGQCGHNIKVINTSGMRVRDLLHEMKCGGYDLAEGYVIQHPSMMELSPSGLNTVRIFTQLNPDGKVDVLGARLRISVNSSVDNLAAGNLAAPVDDESGVVIGPGIYSDINKTDQEYHPVTGIRIPGFRIPYWSETRTMITRVARLIPENRSVGWDVAITAEGPELIEGNHNWCKLLWQLPVKRGLKHILLRYL